MTRSSTLASSRTLPGHGYARRAARASSERRLAGSGAGRLAGGTDPRERGRPLAMAERRQLQRHGRQAMVEVRRKRPARIRLQVLAGRRDDPHVHRLAASAPEAAHLRASRAVRSLAWTPRREAPPISSRNRVPRWAASTSPCLGGLASVNAPRSKPKSSDSTRASGSRAVDSDERAGSRGRSGGARGPPTLFPSPFHRGAGSVVAVPRPRRSAPVVGSAHEARRAQRYGQ